MCSADGKTAGGRRPAGFGAGLRAFGDGLVFLLKTSRSKRHAVAPVAIAGVIFTIAAWALWNLSEPLRTAPAQVEWLPEWARAIVIFILGALMMAVFLVVMWFTAAPVTAAVAAPFLDLLVARVDEVKAGKARSVGGPAARNLIFAIGQSCIMIALILTLNLAAFAVAWIPPVGPIFSFVFLAAGAGLGAIDIATARRAMTFSQKVSLARRNPGAVMGLGTALVLVAFVPCVGIIFTIPAAAVGGGLLIYQMRLRA